MKHEYSGVVVRGLQNGRKFGFPTANIRLNETDLQSGIYAVRVRIDEEWKQGMMYVGTRPTLGLSERTVEIHLFDFSDDIYDREIVFTVEKKFGEEQKFAHTSALIDQIEQFKNEILNYFQCEK
ncbi:MAG: riboflavin kinase [Bacteroidales bacterium]|nr:riboflavin kinase [Bacteroidales bacterium]